MSVIYHYWRHHSPEQMEVETLFLALNMAKNDVEENRAVPEKIILEDGTVLDHDDILDRSGYYSDTGPIIDSVVQDHPPETVPLLEQRVSGDRPSC